MARIKGILFDLGDTLLDFGPVDMPAMFLEGAGLAYSYLQTLSKPLPGFRWFHLHQLWAVRWHYFLSRLTRREFDSARLLVRLARSMGHVLTPEEAAELAWKWYEPLSRHARVEPGVPEMLAGFRRDGLRLGVVSNTFVPGAALDRHLRMLGLMKHLPTRIYSCDVGYRKPHPKIFRAALRAMGVAAHQAVFVGDKVSPDVGGANWMGMTSVLKDPTGRARCWRARPAYRVASLLELPAILAECNRLPRIPRRETGPAGPA